MAEFLHDYALGKPKTEKLPNSSTQLVLQVKRMKQELVKDGVSAILRDRELIKKMELEVSRGELRIEAHTPEAEAYLIQVKKALLARMAVNGSR
ncbi:hypothetical protein AUJ16_02125 [Candidatus Micrarchaeota archaeon CG1_02_60_51]|nr:MAG: hypothetical protein AUJ16_02125 [Candidatus Micrarchaeota archaeon CG1_02_60_51]